MGSRRRPSENKKARSPGLFAMRTAGLDRLDVRRRRAFGALGDVERNLLRLLQRLVAIHLDGAVVGEKILAAVVRRDESEALGVVEPLHGTCCHVPVPFMWRGESGLAPTGMTIKEGIGRPLRHRLRGVEGLRTSLLERSLRGESSTPRRLALFEG